MKAEVLSHLGGPTENLGRLGGNDSTERPDSVHADTAKILRPP